MVRIQVWIPQMFSEATALAVLTRIFFNLLTVIGEHPIREKQLITLSLLISHVQKKFGITLRCLTLQVNSTWYLGMVVLRSLWRLTEVLCWVEDGALMVQPWLQVRTSLASWLVGFLIKSDHWFFLYLIFYFLLNLLKYKTLLWFWWVKFSIFLKKRGGYQN